MLDDGGNLIGLTPAGALGPNVAWAAIDDHHAVARITIDQRTHEVTIEVADNGALKTLSLLRRGNPDTRPFQLHTFGVNFDGEFTTDGYTLPRHVTAGWWPGTHRNGNEANSSARASTKPAFSSWSRPTLKNGWHRRSARMRTSASATYEDGRANCARDQC